MDDILTRWHAGQRFDEHFSGATEPKLAAVARKIRGRITIPDAVAERLRAAGLRTVAVHAHRYFGSFGGLDRGFDEVDLSAAPPENAPWDSDKEASGAKLADAVIAKVDALDTLAKEGAKPVRFFLWAHFLDPHADYVEHEGIDFGKRQRDLYDGEVRYVRISSACRSSCTPRASPTAASGWANA